MDKVDNYEIQRYMIRHEVAPLSKHQRWAVWDMDENRVVCRRDERKDAVEACRDLRDPEGAKLRKLKVVRLYDGFDRQWIDVSGNVTEEEAQRIWNEKTNNGTERTKYADIDYYAIFPADTRMHFSEGRGATYRD